MPAYRKTSQFSAEQNGMIRTRALDVLANSVEALSIKDIQMRDMVICGYTTQKMARELNQLVEMGLVRKAQSKQRKCMVYMAVSVMNELGYEYVD